jgi:hypothetical protein
LGDKLIDTHTRLRISDHDALLLHAGRHNFVTKYVLNSAPVFVILESGSESLIQEREVSIMNFETIFHLDVIYDKKNGKYIVVRDDMCYECDNDQDVLNLIRNFADARFEW